MTFTIPNVGSVLYAAQATPDAGDFAILVAGLQLTGVVSGCTVSSQSSPNMSVAVVTGGTRYLGGAKVTVTASSVTISPADSTNPRWDLIVADGTTGVLSALTGTPAPTVADTSQAVYPSIPTGKIVLAAVYVPSGTTSIVTGLIIDKRVFVPDVTVSGITSTGNIDGGSATSAYGGTTAVDGGTA